MKSPQKPRYCCYLRDTLTVLGFALWSGFGLLKSEWPIILTNSICFCLSGYILLRKLREIIRNEVGKKTAAQFGPRAYQNRPGHNTLKSASLAEVLSQIGRARPSIGGSCASLIAAQIGMVKMAFAVSKRHEAESNHAMN